MKYITPRKPANMLGDDADEGEIQGITDLAIKVLLPSHRHRSSWPRGRS